MGFWVFMLLVSLLTPGLMLFAGWLMAKHPPQKVNGIVGYRTGMSMKNGDTWRFAQEFAGRFWMRWGAITLLPSGLVMALVCGRGEDMVACAGLVLTVLQFVPLLAVCPVTERALRKAFDRDGQRKS